MGTQPFEPFDSEIFASFQPHLRVVVSAQTGFDDFDVNWMTTNSIWFCNTQRAVTAATADMTIFLILAVLRNTTSAEKSCREGRWRRDLDLSQDPNGLTLGIIGLGKIGKLVAQKASAFNMRIQYYSRNRVAEDEKLYGARFCTTLADLLSSSDVVSVHCPLNSETYHLLGPEEFALMKDQSFIVNTSRGSVIHENALIDALKSGKVCRAGLDVFEDESEGKINRYFTRTDRVIVQPHVGGLTECSFRDAEKECFDNIMEYLRSSRPVCPINKIYYRGGSLG